MSLERTGPIRPKRRCRILLVDDSRVNRAVGEAMLRRLDHDVTVAADGREALAALEEACYDLVLMDCMMPGMDGFDAAAEIRRREREDPRRSRAIVVAVTGGAMDSDRERYRAAGMDDCLGKPFTLQALDALVTRCLGGPSPASG
jgi:two-component system, sensor histidine kinase and response regulator